MTNNKLRGICRLFAAGCAAMIGCSSSPTTPHCTGNVTAGRLISVEDQASQLLICNATLTVLPSGPSFGSSSCLYPTPTVRADGSVLNGAFDIRVDAPGYTSTVIHSVDIFNYPCDDPQPAGHACPECQAKLVPASGDAGVHGG